MPNNCLANDCRSEVLSRGLCVKHYWRFKRTGSLNARPKAKAGAGAEWIRQNASYSGNDCLKWPFGSPANGYGLVRIAGVDIPATRYMCIVAHGEPNPASLHALHSCGNGHLGCMTPSHLRWGTAKENAADKIIQGMHQRGDRNAFTKLNPDAVAAIRARTGESTVKLGREFGVAPATISDVINRKTWAWL